MLAVVIAEGVAIVLLGVLVLGLLRSHALILKALHELGAGLELEKEAGTGVSLATTGGKPSRSRTGGSRGTTRNAPATVPRARWRLPRKRPTAGMVRAKSSSRSASNRRRWV